MQLRVTTWPMAALQQPGISGLIGLRPVCWVLGPNSWGHPQTSPHHSRLSPRRGSDSMALQYTPYTVHDSYSCTTSPWPLGYSMVRGPVYPPKVDHQATGGGTVSRTGRTGTRGDH